MPAPYKGTPALSRFSTDTSNDSELDRELLTPPDKTASQCRVVPRGHLVPAHSPDGQFVGTPFSTSNLFEYPFHQNESQSGSKPIAIPTNPASIQTTGHSTNGSSSPSSPHYNRALREVSREAPVPPSLREKVSALGTQTEAARDREGPVAPGSLLKGLLEANNALEDKLKLSNRELLSNIYVFLFAGYETTAHTLAFVVAILALYPDIHARVRAEADNIWPNPTAYENSAYKSDFARLPYTLALFYETLRHFPSEPVLARIVDQDAVLPARKRSSSSNTASNEFDQEFTVMVPKGSVVITDFYGLHMNTQYWGATALEFDPTRFLSPNWPKHAFAPFSGGQRACIGRGFATAEAVRIIASVAQTWDLRCKESLARLPWEERKRALLHWRQESAKPWIRTAGVWGAGAGAAVTLLMSVTPIFKKDILLKVPVLSNYFEDTTPASDKPF
ncbi:hypothetical protein FRC07_001338 [Ceratobasidium sp. 392]|nr:hypothetical protein FRC07_001338 [Ceratobasidium sp. 392]